MKALLTRILAGSDLNIEEAHELMASLLEEATPAPLVAAILTAYAAKGVGVPELVGFRQALVERRRTDGIDLSSVTAGGVHPVDICGTGGDGKDTFNISTTAGFVVAAAGVPVAKHGNYGFSSRCGSSTVLEHLGVPFLVDPAAIAAKLSSCGYAYLHAPLFQPALKAVAPVRRLLGIRTIFNLLGPILNPVESSFQLLGVANRQLFDVYRRYMAYVGSNAAVVWSHDGYDEISLTGPFSLAWRGSCRVYTPEDLGCVRCNPAQLLGGEDTDSHAAVLRTILERCGTQAQTDVVCANAGVALYIAGGVASIYEGVEQAREAIRGGAGARVLETALI